MRSTITLNGINSDTIQGLLIQSLAPITKPLMRTQIEEIDGRDGDTITKLGFSAYNKEITIGLYGDFDINQIISYFNSEGTVTFSNEPDKYYYYQIIDQIDFERLIRFRTATVTMHCQPFKYSTTEGTQVFDNSSNLLTIPNSTTTKNGITVTVDNNIMTISGTGTAATEFYIPIDTLSLSVGKYGMYALGSGTNPEACSLRVINDSPSNANSFGGNYVTLKNNQTVSLIANLSNAKTYNYVYLYIAANKAMDFTLNLSIEDAAQSVVTGEGNLITLEGTAFAPFDKFDLKGDTTQQTYTGKNLVKNYASSTTSSGVTITVNPDGTIVADGTATGNANIIPMTQQQSSNFPAGTYTLWVDQIPSPNGELRVETYRSSALTTRINSFMGERGENTLTFTTTESLRFRVSIIFARSGNVLDNFTISQLQLESGSQKTSYEPYVGGIPAPNPDYPQPVQVVTGEQTVTITDGGSQSQEYEVNLGKNLLNNTATTTTTQGITFTVNEDGTITANGTSTGAAWLTVAEGVSVTGQCFMSGCPSGGGASTYSLQTSGNPPIADSGSGVSVNNLKNFNVFIVIRSGQTVSNLVFKPQIEKGSTATTYAPYFTPIELCKIGDYQDYIYKSGDDWYVRKEIGKIVLDGDGDYNTLGNGNGGLKRFRYTDSTIGTVPELSISTYCDIYQGIQRKFTLDIANSICQHTAQNLLLITTNSTTYTLNDFKTFLSNNPATVYYALATPTDTKITDSSLIAQLETLVTDAHAYRNTTTLVSTSQQLPHIMSVEVAKNNDATITNSGNTTAKPVMTVYGSGTVGIYLNGNQIFNVNIGNNQYITIDTANMEAYKDTTDNLMNRLVDGDYSNFVLQTGENQISFSGSVSKLEISNYSRWI